MAKRSRKSRLPQGSFEATIDGITHDGRGVATVNAKRVFIEGALLHEKVMFRYVEQRSNFDVGVVDQVIDASTDRVEPKCAVYGICGGCSLQHLQPQQQIAAKQQILLDNLLRIGKVTPQQIEEPMQSPKSWGYRTKARLGVRYVKVRQRVLIGFREKRSSFLTDMQRCEVLHPTIGEKLHTIAECIASLTIREQVPQVEIAVAEDHTALVFRHMAPLTDADLELLRQLGQKHGYAIYLQSKGPDTITLFWPEQAELYYTLSQYDLNYYFEPSDFTQVNRELNQLMVARAIAWLDLQPHDRVLDLFCGIGNFTLPIAQQVAAVVGVEGSADLIARANNNAKKNGIANVTFFVADLSKDLVAQPWWKEGFDKVLLDPSRDGAEAALPFIAAMSVKTIVYVSCNPATLARDAGVLVGEYGYSLVRVGAMDMFPHTAHVESIALFQLSN